MATTALTMTSFAVPVPGATLVGDRAGIGQAIVLIHAGICDRTMWDGLFEVLAARYDVIRYDLRGMGQSVPDDGSGDVLFCNHGDLLAVLDQLGIRRAALIGCSFGAGVASDAAIVAPERVAALVLVSARPNGFPWDAATIAEIKRIDALLEASEVAEANEREIRLWVDGPGRGPDAIDPETRRRVSAMNLASLQSGWDGQGTQLLEPLAGERLAEVRAPTLIVVGDQDVPCVVDAATGLATGIADSTTVHFPDAAHLPSMEDPDRFNAVTMAFLDRTLHDHDQT
ncbi:MAG TPA: alpha/beta hydrolase [Thermomicrobiales bacterium]|jgi:pimeloyl-ACP methyl ester carboxylesterase|nr:alpha/beta hydrolase [Thermomicrobiales bacterium]